MSSGSKSPARLEIEPADLDVILTGGFILQGKLGDLVALRVELRKDPRFKVIYQKNSSRHLRIVPEDDYLLIQKLKEGRDNEQ